MKYTSYSEDVKDGFFIMYIRCQGDYWYYKDNPDTYKYSELEMHFYSSAEIRYYIPTKRLLIKSFIQETMCPEDDIFGILKTSDVAVPKLTRDFISESNEWIRVFEHAGEYLWLLQQAGIKLAEHEFLVKIADDINYENWLMDYLCNRNTKPSEALASTNLQGY